MEKFIVPICDVRRVPGKCWNEIIVANSYISCQDKVIEKVGKIIDIEDFNDYNHFIKLADSEDIIIGDITNIEEL